MTRNEGIKRAYAAGATLRDLAAAVGVSHERIRQITGNQQRKRRPSWAQVKSLERAVRRNEKRIRDLGICKHYMQGHTQVETAEHFGVSQSCVMNALRREEVSARPRGTVVRQGDRRKKGAHRL